MREGGEDAGGVSVRHEERRVGAGDVHADAVDAADPDAPAPEALAAHLAARAVRARHVDVHGVGVDGRVVGRLLEDDFEPRFAREVKGVADALVVGVHAEDAGYERAVGAVPAEGVREGVPQREANAAYGPRGKRGRYARAAKRARGVRGGRADHDGPEHLEGRGRGKGLWLCCHEGS